MVGCKDMLQSLWAKQVGPRAQRLAIQIGKNRLYPLAYSLADH